jgi:LuxR family maltose regulon positive regulatory protein
MGLALTARDVAALEGRTLDRLSGPLCDAVTGQHGGKAMLESLEHANLFVVPLDDSRRWYRYHHLFADVLHTHLLEERPGQVAALHRRASQWYEQSGEPSQAIRHALAAGDGERAAGLVELAIPALRRSRQEATVPGLARGHPRRPDPGQARARGGPHRGVDVWRGWSSSTRQSSRAFPG